MPILYFKLAACLILASTCAAFIALLWRRFRLRGLLKIPGLSNPSLFWGHSLAMYNPQAFSFRERLYKTYGSVTRVYGLLGDIQLVVSDPKACNNIFVKDHEVIFDATEAFLTSNMQAFGPSLLSTTGVHHRRQRKLLNPVFSINHMRHMTPIFHRVARQLREKLELIVENGAQEINIADWMGKFALELIGQAGLGYSFGTLDGRNDEYCKALKAWLPSLFSLSHHRSLFPYVYKIFHPQVLKFVGRLLPWPKLNHIMDLAETLNAEARRIYESKRRLLELGDDATVKQVEESKDIIGLLMRASAAESSDDRLSEEELLAQMAILVFTATDTTSSALSRILHLLALHPDVQDKLRKELKDACEGNEELPYDRLISLPFLEAVCCETLRVCYSYPTIPGVMRTYVIDPSRCRRSEVHEIFVPKDTNVYAHILNLNRDPSIWGTDAAEWNRSSVAEANIQGVYANTMTFIGGPRSCMYLEMSETKCYAQASCGSNFSSVYTEVALSRIIPAFRLAPTEAEIVWKLGGLLTPSVKESVKSGPAKLPVMISRA
ncbi:cytochrome P450 [Lactarius quietus]|nr:cytochrome P450 [Lactarius quietus]